MAESALNELMNNAVAVSEMDTEFRTCPEVEANATINKVSLRDGISQKMMNSSNSRGMWVSMNILWDVDSEEAREEMQRDEVFVSQNIFLKVKDDDAGNPTLDIANNQELAVLLKLFDLEGEMTLQEIIDSLIGQLAYVKVEHEPYDGKVMAKVTKVAEAE